MTKQELEHKLTKGEPYTIRFKVPADETVLVQDLIRGEVSFKTNDLDDKVLVKADGMPTYHLANIIDDHEMYISHIIRGEEWLPSAGHHVLIYKALGLEKSMPKFAHLPLILKPDGKGKLSKRDGLKFGFPVFPLDWTGATPEESFKGFKGYGFESAALINFLALLGWNPGTDREIYTLSEMAEIFSLEKIHKAGARFDFDKAKWFNQQYLLAKDSQELAIELMPQAQAQGYNVSPVFMLQFVNLMKERVIFKTDFLEKGYYLFEEVREYDLANATKRWKPENEQKFLDLKTHILAQDFSKPQEMEIEVKQWLHDADLKMGEAMPILRIALSGTMQGPAVYDMMSLLGKPEVETRLNTLFQKLQNGQIN
jgi:glutamyl-tRNA synthetase